MVRVKLPVGLQVLDPRAQQASFCQESSRHSVVTQHSSFLPQASQDWPEQLLLLRGREQRQQDGRMADRDVVLIAFGPWS